MSFSELTTFENWTLRARPGAGKRILLLLHGWTGDENSMWIFTRNLSAPYWILAPRAPYVAQKGGYTWRSPNLPGSWPSVENMSPSAQVLVELVDRWARVNGLDASTFDVAGFSQGGALTFMLGALYPARMGKMGLLSGFAPDGAEQLLAPGHFNGKTVFVAHGTLDEMVPLEMARRTVQLLENAGAQVTYSESPVRHKLSADGLRALETYLA